MKSRDNLFKRLREKLEAPLTEEGAREKVNQLIEGRFMNSYTARTIPFSRDVLARAADELASALIPFYTGIEQKEAARRAQWLANKVFLYPSSPLDEFDRAMLDDVPVAMRRAKEILVQDLIARQNAIRKDVVQKDEEER